MKVTIIISAILLLSMSTFAQFGRLANKAKNKVIQRADNKADRAMDNALDQLEGKGKAATPENEEPSGKDTLIEQARPASYAAYDFVPGAKIIYAEEFSTEALGELPTGWNTNGSGEVVNIEGQSGKWLRLHKSFFYLSANTKALGPDYTIEFDMILDLKNNGWLFPSLQFGVLASGELSTTDNSLLKEYGKYAAVTATIHPGIGVSHLTLESVLANANYYTGSVKEYNELEKYYGKPVHVSIQVQKERYRVWVNGVKAFDAPKAVPVSAKMNQLFFKLSHTNYAEEQYAVYISNIRMATGLPDTRHKLVEEGKFSTTGILFDVNSAHIRPESSGVLKEIATVLRANPEMKISIIGHTSSDGDDKTNMDLSVRRAAAVKEALVNEYGLDAALLFTSGKGETQPVADNATKEGKAANRRVEFIRR
ncbi:MAG: OmpA family protein [Bacteroidetes bacterium]|nr:OmpA family protein [Bacteroidota bacterium]